VLAKDYALAYLMSGVEKFTVPYMTYTVIQGQWIKYIRVSRYCRPLYLSPFVEVQRLIGRKSRYVYSRLVFIVFLHGD